ncbi:MAG: hypothetical protein PHO94_12065, partial [Petrimonas sp.]|nr:hypothetical protein [Petrimonas sp.]
MKKENDYPQYFLTPRTCLPQAGWQFISAQCNLSPLRVLSPMGERNRKKEFEAARWVGAVTAHDFALKGQFSNLNRAYSPPIDDS